MEQKVRVDWWHCGQETWLKTNSETEDIRLDLGEGGQKGRRAIERMVQVTDGQMTIWRSSPTIGVYTPITTTEQLAISLINRIELCITMLSLLCHIHVTISAKKPRFTVTCDRPTCRSLQCWPARDSKQRPFVLRDYIYFLSNAKVVDRRSLIHPRPMTALVHGTWWRHYVTWPWPNYTVSSISK